MSVMKVGLLCLMLLVVLVPDKAYGENCSLLRLWWCVRNQLGWLNHEESCSYDAMKTAYNEMKAANCLNCDKYFHCIGNYKAVYGCQSSETNRRTAKIISDCREDVCREPGADDDQVANEYGRNGYNCAARYLCSYKCAYNPSDKTCKKSNCRK